ncbi:hypothetical protein FACS1894217_14350 [Clostridia bacterium]|nr:hypothetical protein FACS1894217_14350 [Clostridia bacterium]
MEYTVNFSWDEEAGVWAAVCDAIPLALESNSFDALVEKVKICAAEIIALNTSSTPARLCMKSERWESIA